MEVRDIEQVTAEGTNAGGDEVEATSAREADADSTIAELVSRARAAMGIFEHYDQERVDEVVQTVAWATNPVIVQGPSSPASPSPRAGLEIPLR